VASDLYVALSGQMANETRLATIANNVANMRTAGFRAEAVTFETVLSDYVRDDVAFAQSGPAHFDLVGGAMEPTGNPLDVAIVGGGWFQISTGNGVAYTRDGRLQITEAGDLLTLTGHPILDDGGAPMAVNPNGGTLSIGVDGSITQDGALVGALGLVALDPNAALTRYGDSAFFADGAATPIDDRIQNGVRQGFVEGSNVNAIQAITDLIRVQRAFENGAAAIRDREDSLGQAIRTLGAE
jgi:flagellar basal-body rod protein FlgF